MIHIFVTDLIKQIFFTFLQKEDGYVTGQFECWLQSNQKIRQNTHVVIQKAFRYDLVVSLHVTLSLFRKVLHSLMNLANKLLIS